MDSEKKCTREEEAAALNNELRELDLNEVEQVAGGDEDYYLKNGTKITVELLEQYAKEFQNAGLSASKLNDTAKELGFPPVDKSDLEYAERKRGDHVDAWRVYVKRIITHQKFYL